MQLTTLTRNVHCMAAVFAQSEAFTAFIIKVRRHAPGRAYTMPLFSGGVEHAGSRSEVRVEINGISFAHNGQCAVQLLQLILLR